MALIAGGHTFGKTHGAGPASNVGPDPEDAGLELQGLGWQSSHGSGKGADAITSGLEVTWTTTPTKWGNGFFQNLFGYEWELSKSPAGAHQWVAKNAQPTIPHAFDASRKLLPTMLTTDLSLRFDPAYEKISRRFMDHPEELAEAFARAWFKLTHRDMGPRARYLGPEVPAEELIWQDPIPRSTTRWSTTRTWRRSSRRCWPAACRCPSWCPPPSASTFRGSDKRGGANARASGWRRRRTGGQPAGAAGQGVEGAGSHTGRLQPRAVRRQEDLAGRPDRAGGCAGVEQAAKKAGVDVTVPFAPGRMDATQEQTDVDSFAPLEPVADGFRNYLKTRFAVPAEALLIDRAQLLTPDRARDDRADRRVARAGGGVGQDRHGLHRPAGRAEQ